jgi:hypothetical protein
MSIAPLTGIQTQSNDVTQVYWHRHWGWHRPYYWGWWWWRGLDTRAHEIEATPKMVLRPVTLVAG